MTSTSASAPEGNRPPTVQHLQRPRNRLQHPARNLLYNVEQKFYARLSLRNTPPRHLWRGGRGVRRRGGPMCPPTIPQGWASPRPSAKVAPPVWETTGVFAHLPASGQSLGWIPGVLPQARKELCTNQASPPTAGKCAGLGSQVAPPHPGKAGPAGQAYRAEGVGGCHPSFPDGVHAAGMVAPRFTHAKDGCPG